MATKFVSTTGDNANTGGILDPWRTHAYAALNCAPGDTVYSRGGTYVNDQALFAQSGVDAGHKTSFANYQGEPVVLDGNGNPIFGFDFNGHEYIDVGGYEIKNCRWGAVSTERYALPLVRGLSVHDINAHDNTYLQSGDAVINMQYADLPEVRRITIADESPIKGGIRVAFGHQAVVSEFSVRRVQGDGINFSRVDGAIFEFFTCGDFVSGPAPPLESQHSDGFSADQCDNVTIRYGLVFDETQLIYIALNDNDGAAVRNLNVCGVGFFANTYGDGTSDNGPPGIFIDGRGNNHVIQDIGIFNCYFGSLGYPGVAIYLGPGGTVSNIRLANNICNRTRANIRVGTSGAAFELQDVAAAVISRYNWFYKCRPPFTGSVDAPNWMETGPLFVPPASNTSDPLAYESNPDPLVELDPGFGGYGSGYNFRLKNNSPCRKAGDPNLASLVTLPSPFLDMDGKNRGAAPHDLGMFELLGAGPQVLRRRKVLVSG